MKEMSREGNGIEDNVDEDDGRGKVVKEGNTNITEAEKY